MNTSHRPEKPGEAVARADAWMPEMGEGGEAFDGDGVADGAEGRWLCLPLAT